MKAAKTDPQHYVLIKNVEAARAWFKDQGPVKNLPLKLVASHEFQLLERTAQPSLPGPLPDDFAELERRASPFPPLPRRARRHRAHHPRTPLHAPFRQAAARAVGVTSARVRVRAWACGCAWAWACGCACGRGRESVHVGGAGLTAPIRGKHVYSEVNALT